MIKLFSWFRRRRKVNEIQRAGTRAGAIAHIHVTNPWHAVEGCTLPKTCKCKYRHFSDRRSGPRRATESELFQNALSRHTAAQWADERRAQRGRRATDGH